MAINEGRPRRQHCLAFRPGDSILVFTDGLIERRSEDIDEGRARLSAALLALVDTDLGGALRDIVAAVADETQNDDVAAVALRRHSAA